MEIFNPYTHPPEPLLTEVFDIGIWNMVATPSITIDVGFIYSSWRFVQIKIDNDVWSVCSKLSIDGMTSGYWEHSVATGNTILSLYRGVGGRYNSIDYDRATGNRGNILLVHI